MSGWSIATIFSGFAFSPASLIISRIIVGAGEAPIFPAFASIVRGNYSITQRGRATAIFDGGSYVGTAVTAPLVVGIILIADWRTSFFVCGALGFIWVFFWARCFKQIATSTTQSFMLVKNINLAQWFAIVRNPKMASASFGFFCYNYAKSFFLTWFLAYLIQTRGFELLEVGILGAVPALCAAAAAYFAGHLTDRMIHRGMSVTLARKLPICVGLILAISISLASIVESEWISFALLSFSFMALISASPGIWAIPGDIAPTHHLVATVGAIQNTFSNVAGLVAPVVTGVLIYYTGSFVWPLMLTSVICIIGSAVYWFGVGELRPMEIAEVTDEK